jgi:hypothetical protein
MTWDLNKIILSVIGLLVSIIGSLLLYTADLIRDDIALVKADLNMLKQANQYVVATGGWDFIADIVADKDSLTTAQMKLLEYILEESR